MDAAVVYEVSLESQWGPLIRPVRVVGSLVGSALGLGRMRPVGDCVVRRDGREVLRFEDDGAGYDNMRRQLAAMTAAEFAKTWGIED